MKRLVFVILLIVSSVVLVISCKKWKDPAAVNDPRLTNPYCNNPLAVNYNWGFPGKPDSTVCFFPSDIFRGTYIFNDSIFLPDNTYVSFRVDTFSIYAVSENKIALVGFCSSHSDSIKLTGLATYQATVDTVAALLTGQTLCRVVDTVNGTITKDQIDTTVLHVNFSVASDTGVNLHFGNAIKQK